MAEDITFYLNDKSMHDKTSQPASASTSYSPSKSSVKMDVLNEFGIVATCDFRYVDSDLRPTQADPSKRDLTHHDISECNDFPVARADPSLPDSHFQAPAMKLSNCLDSVSFKDNLRGSAELSVVSNSVNNDNRDEMIAEAHNVVTSETSPGAESDGLVTDTITSNTIISDTNLTNNSMQVANLNSNADLAVDVLIDNKCDSSILVDNDITNTSFKLAASIICSEAKSEAELQENVLVIAELDCRTVSNAASVDSAANSVCCDKLTGISGKITTGQNDEGLTSISERRSESEMDADTSTCIGTSTGTELVALTESDIINCQIHLKDANANDGNRAFLFSQSATNIETNPSDINVPLWSEMTDDNVYNSDDVEIQEFFQEEEIAITASLDDCAEEESNEDSGRARGAGNRGGGRRAGGVVSPGWEEMAKGMTYDLQQGYRILHEIMNETNKGVTWPFLDAVDVSMRGYEDYNEKIKRPMWLRKIRGKFEDGSYETITSFVSDMRLMLENCYRYNGPDHTISRRAQKLETMLNQKLALLSRELREKTSFAATAGQTTECLQFGSRRQKLVVHSDSTALLNQLRREAREREKEAKRQQQQQRRAAYEKYVSELPLWEDRLFEGEELRKQMKAMWELPQIGQFLFLCAAPLNLVGAVSQCKLERCMLMPRESSTMKLVITALLSTPHQRLTNSADKTSMSYKSWNRALCSVLAQWYKQLDDFSYDIRLTAEKLGIDEKFFRVAGRRRNPMRKRLFHEISFYRRVWIIKSLCDHLLETQKSLYDALELQPLSDQRESLLGEDSLGNSYIHFPLFCGDDLRIYRQCKVVYPPPLTVADFSATTNQNATEGGTGASATRHRRKGRGRGRSRGDTAKAAVAKQQQEFLTSPRVKELRLKQTPRSVSSNQTSRDVSSDDDDIADDITDDASVNTDLYDDASENNAASIADSDNISDNDSTVTPAKRYRTTALQSQSSSTILQSDYNSIENPTDSAENSSAAGFLQKVSPSNSLEKRNPRLNMLSPKRTSRARPRSDIMPSVSKSRSPNSLMTCELDLEALSSFPRRSLRKVIEESKKDATEIPRRNSQRNFRHVQDPPSCEISSSLVMPADDAVASISSGDLSSGRARGRGRPAKLPALTGEKKLVEGPEDASAIVRSGVTLALPPDGKGDNNERISGDNRIVSESCDWQQRFEIDAEVPGDTYNGLNYGHQTKTYPCDLPSAIDSVVGRERTDQHLSDVADDVLSPERKRSRVVRNLNNELSASGKEDTNVVDTSQIGLNASNLSAVVKIDRDAGQIDGDESADATKASTTELNSNVSLADIGCSKNLHSVEKDINTVTISCDMNDVYVVNYSEIGSESSIVTEEGSMKSVVVNKEDGIASDSSGGHGVTSKQEMDCDIFNDAQVMHSADSCIDEVQDRSIEALGFRKYHVVCNGDAAAQECDISTESNSVMLSVSEDVHKTEDRELGTACNRKRTHAEMKSGSYDPDRSLLLNGICGHNNSKSLLQLPQNRKQRMRWTMTSSMNFVDAMIDSNEVTGRGAGDGITHHTLEHESHLERLILIDEHSDGECKTKDVDMHKFFTESGVSIKADAGQGDWKFDCLDIGDPHVPAKDFLINDEICKSDNKCAVDIVKLSDSCSESCAVLLSNTVKLEYQSSNHKELHSDQPGSPSPMHTQLINGSVSKSVPTDQVKTLEHDADVSCSINSSKHLTLVMEADFLLQSELKSEGIVTTSGDCAPFAVKLENRNNCADAVTGDGKCKESNLPSVMSKQVVIKQEAWECINVMSEQEVNKQEVLEGSGVRMTLVNGAKSEDGMLKLDDVKIERMAQDVTKCKLTLSDEIDTENERKTDTDETKKEINIKENIAKYAAEMENTEWKEEDMKEEVVEMNTVKKQEEALTTEGGDDRAEILEESEEEEEEELLPDFNEFELVVEGIDDLRQLIAKFGAQLTGECMAESADSTSRSTSRRANMVLTASARKQVTDLHQRLTSLYEELQQYEHRLNQISKSTKMAMRKEQENYVEEQEQEEEEEKQVEHTKMDAGDGWAKDESDEWNRTSEHVNGDETPSRPSSITSVLDSATSTPSSSIAGAPPESSSLPGSRGLEGNGMYIRSTRSGHTPSSLSAKDRANQRRRGNRKCVTAIGGKIDSKTLRGNGEGGGEESGSGIVDNWKEQEYARRPFISRTIVPGGNADGGSVGTVVGNSSEAAVAGGVVGQTSGGGDSGERKARKRKPLTPAQVLQRQQRRQLQRQRQRELQQQQQLGAAGAGGIVRLSVSQQMESTATGSATAKRFVIGKSPIVVSSQRLVLSSVAGGGPLGGFSRVGGGASVAVVGGLGLGSGIGQSLIRIATPSGNSFQYYTMDTLQKLLSNPRFAAALAAQANASPIVTASTASMGSLQTMLRPGAATLASPPITPRVLTSTVPHAQQKLVVVSHEGRQVGVQLKPVTPSKQIGVTTTPFLNQVVVLPGPPHLNHKFIVPNQPATPLHVISPTRLATTPSTPRQTVTVQRNPITTSTRLQWNVPVTQSTTLSPLRTGLVSVIEGDQKSKLKNASSSVTVKELLLGGKTLGLTKLPNNNYNSSVTVKELLEVKASSSFQPYDNGSSNDKNSSKGQTAASVIPLSAPIMSSPIMSASPVSTGSSLGDVLWLKGDVSVRLKAADSTPSPSLKDDDAASILANLSGGAVQDSTVQMTPLVSDALDEERGLAEKSGEEIAKMTSSTCLVSLSSTASHVISVTTDQATDPITVPVDETTTTATSTTQNKTEIAPKFSSSIPVTPAITQSSELRSPLVPISMSIPSSPSCSTAASISPCSSNTIPLIFPSCTTVPTSLPLKISRLPLSSPSILNPCSLHVVQAPAAATVIPLRSVQIISPGRQRSAAMLSPISSRMPSSSLNSTLRNTTVGSNIFKSDISGVSHGGTGMISFFPVVGGTSQAIPTAPNASSLCHRIDAAISCHTTVSACRSSRPTNLLCTNASQSTLSNSSLVSGPSRGSGSTLVFLQRAADGSLQLVPLQQPRGHTGINSPRLITSVRTSLQGALIASESRTPVHAQTPADTCGNVPAIRSPALLAVSGCEGISSSRLQTLRFRASEMGSYSAQLPVERTSADVVSSIVPANVSHLSVVNSAAVSYLVSSPSFSTTSSKQLSTLGSPISFLPSTVRATPASNIVQPPSIRLKPSLTQSVTVQPFAARAVVSPRTAVVQLSNIPQSAAATKFVVRLAPSTSSTRLQLPARPVLLSTSPRKLSPQLPVRIQISTPQRSVLTSGQSTSRTNSYIIPMPKTLVRPGLTLRPNLNSEFEQKPDLKTNISLPPGLAIQIIASDSVLSTNISVQPEISKGVVPSSISASTCISDGRSLNQMASPSLVNSSSSGQLSGVMASSVLASDVTAESGRTTNQLSWLVQAAKLIESGSTAEINEKLTLEDSDQARMPQVATPDINGLGERVGFAEEFDVGNS